MLEFTLLITIFSKLPIILSIITNTTARLFTVFLGECFFGKLPPQNTVIYTVNYIEKTISFQNEIKKLLKNLSMQLTILVG